MNFKELWTAVFINEMSMSETSDFRACAKIADYSVDEYKKRAESLAKDDVDMSIKNRLYIDEAVDKANESIGVCDLPGCMIHDPERKKKSKEDTH